jgi:hypothetical protein
VLPASFKGSCKKYADNALSGINTTRETVLADSIRVTNDETPEMSDADLVALKKAAPLIKEMLMLNSFAPFGILLSASTTLRSKL